MNIILLEKVYKLGQIGEIVKVKPGYARNFLVPQGKALYATKENTKIFDEKKSQIKANNETKKLEAENFSKSIKGKEIVIIRAASDAGQLYGSVNSNDIVKILKSENLNIEKNQVQLNKSIKYLTFEKIKIILHPEVIIDVTLNVARSDDEAKKQSKDKKSVIDNTDIKKVSENELIKDKKLNHTENDLVSGNGNKKISDDEIIPDAKSSSTDV